ncbi:unnamed protein product [Spirodela intermedia]|uniref:CASP-like protein n=2 Tax=Spirodela intermedia TaxID=51605 RepID=A0A7I8JZ85_SPIIN|nr:unnamed protein product [Spirodela intermedia]CAA6654685.1 unnamed protein product [Spirodela intermedia]CAA7389342.1 unnamed protein product [Spirodela intermedia]
MALCAKGNDKSVPPSAAVNPLNADVEDPAVMSVLRRWKREGYLEMACLVLRVLAWVFSALAFVVMASNKHGDWRDFDKYQEYRYLLAISVLAFVYATVQLVLQILRPSGRKDSPPTRATATADFAGDQVAAYLLMSALSAAAPITNRMREGAENTFTTASSASITMTFFAFAVLAMSALVSGFKLSRHNYT